MDASSGGMHESWAGDTNLVFWHSDDLVNWYQISIFDVADKSGFETTIRAWAPQVIYDSSVGRYMVYWSNYLGNWDEAIYYSYTDDFINFDDPKCSIKHLRVPQLTEILLSTTENIIFFIKMKQCNCWICYI